MKRNNLVHELRHACPLFFVAGAPKQFCCIFGRLGFDSFLKGSTLIFTSENEKNTKFEDRSRSRTLFFSKET